MKKYGDLSLRKMKTDKMDAIKIAQYGIDNWHNLVKYEPRDSVYSELQALAGQYDYYIKCHTRAKVHLSSILEKTMPGFNTVMYHQSDFRADSKYAEIACRYWHFDNITGKRRKAFVSDYCKWAKKKGYLKNEALANKIYEVALIGIPILPSNATSTKMFVQEAVETLLDVNRILIDILAHMQTLAETLPEYEMLLDMPGIGKNLASRIIAAIGDVRRFKNGSSLVAFAGLDVPMYQSGQFTSTKVRISKRGSAQLRHVGYLVSSAILRVKPTRDSAIYDFMCRKISEGKHSKVVKVAGINKFLRIYYARVMELYAT
jgi:transposase